MKKILLSVVVSSSLLMAADVAVDQEKLAADIAAAKAQKSAAEAKLAALEAKLPQNQDIMTHLKVGYMTTSGNTDTETFSAEGTVKKEWGNNNLKLSFDGQYGNADSVLTKSKYFVGLDYGYKFTKTFSFTYIIGYKNDRFSSYNYQAYTGPGAKYEAYKSESQALNLEGSILVSQDEYQITETSDTYSSYQAKVTYELQVMSNLKFNQDLAYRSSFEDSENYFAYSKSALTSKISDILSAGISYTIDYANLVAPGVEQQDNTLAAFISVDY